MLTPSRKFVEEQRERKVLKMQLPQLSGSRNWGFLPKVLDPGWRKRSSPNSICVSASCKMEYIHRYLMDKDGDTAINAPKRCAGDHKEDREKDIIQ